MKEIVDVEGCISFYEEYGVICDVFQNYLMEVFIFVVMELFFNVSSVEVVLQYKFQVFQVLWGLQRGSVVVGQYQFYSEQVCRELQKLDSFYSLMLIFVVVFVYVDNFCWEGVFFILMFGKVLDERVGYVWILFKNQVCCVQSEKYWVVLQSQCLFWQFIFYIGYGDLGSFVVLVSRNLFRFFLFFSWKEMEGLFGFCFFGSFLFDYYVYSFVQEWDVYFVFLFYIFYGWKDFFIIIENLLVFWGFWIFLLESLVYKILCFYFGGVENGCLLDFEFSSGWLFFFQQQLEQLVLGLGLVLMFSDFQVFRVKY